MNTAKSLADDATNEAQKAKDAAKDLEKTVKNAGKTDTTKKQEGTEGTDAAKKPEETDTTQKPKANVTKTVQGDVYVKNNTNVRFYTDLTDSAISGKEVIKTNKGYVLAYEFSNKSIISQADFNKLSIDEQAKYKKDNSAGAGATLNVFAAIDGAVNIYNTGSEIVDGIGNLGKTPETGDTSTESGLTPEELEAQAKAKAEEEAEAKRKAAIEEEYASFEAEMNAFWSSIPTRR